MNGTIVLTETVHLVISGSQTLEQLISTEALNPFGYSSAEVTIFLVLRNLLQN